MWMALQSATEQIFANPARVMAKSLNRAFGRSLNQLQGKANHIRPDTSWGWPGGEANSIRNPVVRLIPGDREIAQSLYERRFGQKLTAEDVKLGWLKHFCASNKVLYAIYSLDLVHRIASQDRLLPEGHDAAKALLALSWDGPHLVHLAGQDRDENLFVLVTQLTKRVYHQRPAHAQDALLRAASLLSAHVTFRGLESIRKHAVDSLARALQDLILADGSHRSHRSEDLLRVVLILLPLTRAMIEADEIVPDELRLAIDRMLPMLRAMTLGDGGLICLHHSPPHREAVKAVLEAAQLSGASSDPIFYAAEAEIAALRQGDTAIVADCADNAFEMSHGTHRLCLVECISPRRSTSSLTEHGASSEGAILRLNDETGPRKLLYIAGSGLDLRAEDYLAMDEEIRIHAPDSVTVLTDQDGLGLRLRTLDNGTWKLTQRGGTLALSNRCISITPSGAKPDGRVNWSLKKL